MLCAIFQRVVGSQVRGNSVSNKCLVPLQSLLYRSFRGEWKQGNLVQGCPTYCPNTTITVSARHESYTTVMSGTKGPVSPLLGLDGQETESKITLLSKTPVNHDTSIFTFAFPSSQQTLGVPVGQHVGLEERINNKDEMRKYTPLDCDTQGNVEFVIKVYGACADFPEGGKLTQHLDRMSVGDAIKVLGPRGRLSYLGRGDFLIRDEKDSPPRSVHVKKVNMVAGGTGIAPMIQLLRAKAKDPEDMTQMSMLFANQTEPDIIMREELEQLHQKKVLNNLWYTLDKPPQDWKFSTGYVTETMLKEHLFPPSDETITLMCGRKAMVRGLVRPLLLDLQHKDSLIFKY